MSIIVMLFATVEPMSATQRRCWKTGLKMEEDVNYFFIYLLLYLETRKSLKDQKSCEK